MEPDRRDDQSFYDELLGSALRHYSRSEPQIGLEQRVLCRLEAAQPARHRKWFWDWRWMSAGAAAVAAIAISVGLAVRPAPEKQPVGATLENNLEAVLPSGPRAAAPQHVAPAKPILRAAAPRRMHPPAVTSRAARVAEPAPKLAVFPTPAPPTRQELLLARVAAEHPELLKQLASFPREAAKPLEVPKLEVAPLQIAPLDGGSQP